MDNKNRNKDNREASVKYVKYGMIAFVVVIVAALAYAAWSYFTGGYVVKVGNETVSAGEYKFYLGEVKSNILTGLQQANPSLDTSTFDWNTKVGGDTAINLAKKQALDQVESMKVQLIKAKEAKMTLSQQDQSNIDATVNSILSQYKNNKSDAENYVKTTYGVSLDEFKNILKETQLVRDYMTQQVQAEKATDADIKPFYDKNPDLYKSSQFRPNGEEAVWVAQILIPTVDLNTNQALPQDQQDAAKKTADEALAKAKNGEDFAQLVKQYSKDTGSVDYGGQYVFAKGQMDPAFEQASFALNPGQISELVKSQYGYHIIQLIEKIPQGQPVSLKCAQEYHEYGVNAVKLDMYQKQVDSWKSGMKINVNQSVYASIK